MKKITSIITVCVLLSSTGYIYAENNQQDLNNKLSENREEQGTLDKQIGSLDSKIAEIEKNIESSNDEINKLDEEVEDTKAEIQELEGKISENEEALGKRLKAINSNYSMGFVKVILSSSSLSDFFNNIYIVKQVVDQDKVLLKELDVNKSEIETKEKQLEDKKVKQEELKMALEKDNQMIESDKAELEGLKDKLTKEEDDLESEISKLAAEAAAKLAAEKAAQDAQNSQNSQNNNETGAVISSGSWPVPGYSRVSSPYGYRNHPILNRQEFHTGIDIPAPQGTPVTSFDDGKVIFSGVKGGYGNTIMIQHDDGKVTLYAHNSALTASVGDRVQKGQVVAKIGSTGMSTGPHLHFEIRINGSHTNPMNYL
ncbi:murein hydrolase activator EnvC family protein [Romboutsia weinsteinii]|nr:M23 family metallopeptidase [Romboutsia weinsteinii]